MRSVDYCLASLEEWSAFTVDRELDFATRRVGGSSFNTDDHGVRPFIRAKHSRTIAESH